MSSILSQPGPGNGPDDSRRLGGRRSAGTGKTARRPSKGPGEGGGRPPEKGATRPIDLAIATQPTLFRDALSRFLSQKNLNVVGQTFSEDQTAEVLIRSRPQVLLLDYEALGPNAEGIILRLRRLAPSTRILVMATRSGDETVERVLRAGASGLVGKQLDLDTLIRAIRLVASGEIWANRRTTALALTHLTEPDRASLSDRGLTKREHQVVDGVTRGLRNKEIARQLGISEKTVKSHLGSIFQKLGLDGRFALALFEQRPDQS
jgi:DNA-binding NarL/FixJ family response regulator